MASVLTAAQNGSIYNTDASQLERVIAPYITNGAYIGAAEGLEPLIAMGLGFDTALINEAAAAFAREYIYTAYDSGLARAIDAHTQAVIHREVSAWFEAGGELDNLVEALTPTFGRQRAQTIAVTEITNAIAGGNIAAWKDANKQLGTEIVTGSRWTTANDELVCPVCSALGGLTFSEDGAVPASIADQERSGIVAGLGDAFVHPGGRGAQEKFAGMTYERPPAHPRCRCTLTPVVAL